MTLISVANPWTETTGVILKEMITFWQSSSRQCPDGFHPHRSACRRNWREDQCAVCPHAKGQAFQIPLLFSH